MTKPGSCYILLIIFLFLPGCGSTIALYDQYAYTQVTSIKVDALDVMENADREFDAYSKQVKMVDLAILKAMEYERHRPKNAIINEMWAKIYDPEANLYGGFIARWKDKKTLDPSFIADQRALVGLAFDQIAELQSKLKKRK